MTFLRMIVKASKTSLPSADQALQGLFQTGACACPSGAHAHLIGGLPHLKQDDVAQHLADMDVSKPHPSLWNPNFTRRFDLWRTQEHDRWFGELDYTDNQDLVPTPDSYPKALRLCVVAAEFGMHIKPVCENLPLATSNKIGDRDVYPTNQIEQPRGKKRRVTAQENAMSIAIAFPKFPKCPPVPKPIARTKLI